MLQISICLLIHRPGCYNEIAARVRSLAQANHKGITDAPEWVTWSPTFAAKRRCLARKGALPKLSSEGRYGQGAVMISGPPRAGGK